MWFKHELVLSWYRNLLRSLSRLLRHHNHSNVLTLNQQYIGTCMFAYIYTTTYRVKNPVLLPQSVVGFFQNEWFFFPLGWTIGNFLYRVTMLPRYQWNFCSIQKWFLRDSHAYGIGTKFQIRCSAKYFEFSRFYRILKQAGKGRKWSLMLFLRPCFTRTSIFVKTVNRGPHRRGSFLVSQKMKKTCISVSFFF